MTFASWGGSYQEAQRKAYLDPIEKETGIKIREETLGGLTEVRAQVFSGAVTWDLVDLGATECAQGQKEGLLEPLDYNIVNVDGFAKDAYDKDWAAIIYYSTIIAYNPEVKNPPKNWTDFFDVKDFPGRRALYGRPQTMIEGALLADGVAPDKLYPLDLDRAFAKLKQIKPSIDVWWTSGAQSVQLLADGEVDMLAMWNGRVDALRDEGIPVDVTWKQGTLSMDCLAIPKGSKHKDAAMKVLARMISPELQANMPSYINYGPTTSLAFETGKITDAQKKISPSSPEHAKDQAVVKAAYWAEHGAEIQERWDAFMTE
ncbi:ABC transporter substrate-binding protein [Pseudooceanicola sp. CBS1P-1]|uniref:ABC transporter substrate-binding protein n=1 Tax=Pseudooceanicola TaxID=1679449 RepID=UPI001C013431|nr:MULTISPECIES: ABC transporter substrate-binding protein [Pseudooceanicola]MBT9385246.1 ABC transporter substrate-binding protein [Pseudooceanicola endophyticus]